MRRTALFVGLCLFVVVMAHMAAGQQVVKKKAPVHETRYLEYEGMLTDPSGENVTGEYSMTFRMYDSLTGETDLWEETHVVVVEEGVFRVILGKKSQLPWGEEKYPYISVSVAGEELSPRQPITKRAGSEGEKDIVSPGGSDLIVNPPHMALFWDERYVDVTGDTMVGDLYVDTQVGIGTRSPSEKLDVVGTVQMTGIKLLTGATDGYVLTSDGSGVGSWQPAPGGGGGGWSDDGTVVRLETGSDSVAIGSATPSAKLYVEANGSGSTIKAINNSGGIALRGGSYTNSGSANYGVWGLGSNTGAGGTYGGYFSTATDGTGEHYGLMGMGYGSSSSAVYGSYGRAENTGSGTAFGGYFWTDSDGTGTHMGVRALANSSSSSGTYGTYSFADNTSSGTAYGGYFFTAPGSGTGTRHGLRAEGYGSSSNSTYGTSAYAENTSSGSAFGGYFTADSPGTGYHYGLYAEGLGASSTSAYGINSLGKNSGSGRAYGAKVKADSTGTGEHYGVYAESYGASSSSVKGIYASAEATATGLAIGGHFHAASNGGGAHLGVYAEAYGSSAINNIYGSKSSAWGESNHMAKVYGTYNYVRNLGSGRSYAGYFDNSSSSATGWQYGIKSNVTASNDSLSTAVSGYGFNSGTGDIYGGHFEADEQGTGDHYGIYSVGSHLSANSAYGSYNSALHFGSGLTYGTYGKARNTSSGSAYAGRFIAEEDGTGTHYGLRASGYGNSSNSTYGAYGYAYNDGSGNAYGTYGYVLSSGTGTHYGVYGYELEGGSGAAVYASGDMIASGAKPAVVKTSSGHRLLYAMESPEVWFEDIGKGQLVNGKAHIELDPLFLETVTIDESHTMEVFIQLRGDCKGTYVTTGDTGFDVMELQGGTSSAAFSYRVMAKRKGYEDERLRETDVGYDDPNMYPELLAEIEKQHEEDYHREESEWEESEHARNHIEDEHQRIEEMRKEEEQENSQRRKDHRQEEMIRREEMQKEQHRMEENRREEEMHREELQKKDQQIEDARLKEQQRQIEETRSAALQHEKLRTEGVR